MIPTIIDLYHGEDVPEPDFDKFKKAGVLGIIHKCTEGATLVDDKYREREAWARSLGLLWGAYHFLRDADPALQAQYFVGHLEPDWKEKGTLLVVDHEDTAVRMWQCLRCLQMIEHITGKTPWLYSGFLIRQQQDNRHAPVFSEYPLWLAEYGSVAKVPQPWTKFALWQYTDSAEIPGVVGKWDGSRFDGTAEELAAAWGAPPPTVAENDENSDLVATAAETATEEASTDEAQEELET